MHVVNYSARASYKCTERRFVSRCPISPFGRGERSTVRERKDEKKKNKIIFHGAAALLRNHPLLLFFLFASQLLTQPSIKEKKKKKTNCTDSTMASVCRDLHQVSVRYESSSAQSTVRYRVEVRVTDLRMA